MRCFFVFILIFSAIVVWGQYDQYEEDGFKPNLGFKGIAGKGAIIYLSSDYGITPCFGLWTDIGNITKEIGLDAGFEYWNAGRNEHEATVRKSNIAIYATVKYELEFEPISPFLGGGLGVNLYTKKMPDEWEQPDEKDNKLELHIDMGGLYSINEKIDIEGRIKINFSDVSAYGLHISGIFRTGK